VNHLSIVLFDGVCNLCNRSVQFILRNDRKRKFKFASLQGKTGQALSQQHGIGLNELNSFVLIDDGKVYTRSTAFMRVLKNLGGGWAFFSFLIIIPVFIRDAVYNWVARNRYNWFGKRDSCMVPGPAIKDRFLD
jgi:predicted DCC family thiol-disulfide oxidoreductase YuxK